MTNDNAEDDKERAAYVGVMFVGLVLINPLLHAFSIFDSLSVFEGISAGIYVGGIFVCAIVAINVFYNYSQYTPQRDSTKRIFFAFSVLFFIVGALILITADVVLLSSTIQKVIFALAVIFPLSYFSYFGFKVKFGFSAT
ncbi:hypothetical protein ACXYN8_08175 [Altererythrobacter sp. CAU 1778]